METHYFAAPFCAHLYLYIYIVFDGLPINLLNFGRAAAKISVLSPEVGGGRRVGGGVSARYSFFGGGRDAAGGEKKKKKNRFVEREKV